MFLIGNYTTIRLSFGDAIRALLGRAIHVHTLIEVTVPTEVVETTQTTSVDPLIAWRWAGAAPLTVTPSE